MIGPNRWLRALRPICFYTKASTSPAGRPEDAPAARSLTHVASPSRVRTWMHGVCTAVYPGATHHHPWGSQSILGQKRQASRDREFMRCQKITRSKAAGPSRSHVLSFAAPDPVANPVCMPLPFILYSIPGFISRRPALKSKRNPVERPAANGSSHF